MKFREEVLNVTLAQILRSYGLIANPEIIISNKLPDVRIVVGGLKVILEGKIETQRKALEKQAKNRLTSGIADISIAIFYPKSINEVEDLPTLRTKMQGSYYSGIVFYWDTNGTNTIKLDKKSVSELVDVINRVYTLYIKNDLLVSKIEEIESEITKLTGEGQQTSLFYHFNAVEGKLRRVLGIDEEDGEEDGEEEKR